MEKLIIIVYGFAVSCFAFASPGQDQEEEEYYLVGPSGIRQVLPDLAIYEYKSEVFTNETFRVEYSADKKTFTAFKNKQEIEVKDEVFDKLSISPYDFNFQEYYTYLGTDDPPLKCQTLFFYVMEHELIVAGNFQLCETEPLRIRLRAILEDDYTQLVYDNSISNEIHKDGFWEEVWSDEISEKN